MIFIRQLPFVVGSWRLDRWSQQLVSGRLVPRPAASLVADHANVWAAGAGAVTACEGFWYGGRTMHPLSPATVLLLRYITWILWQFSFVVGSRRLADGLSSSLVASCSFNRVWSCQCLNSRSGCRNGMWRCLVQGTLDAPSLCCQNASPPPQISAAL